MPTKTPTKRTQALAEAGAPQPETKLSPSKLRQMKQAAEVQIDEFMKKVGYTNPAERTDAQGWRYLGLGSAEGRAGVIEHDGELFLRAEAVMMSLPSDKDLILPLMRELLEYNAVIPGLARLGIMGEAVFVSISQPVVELLGPDDFAFCIHRVMRLADDLDDTFKAKYGGTVKKRVAPSKPVAKTPAGKVAKTPAGNVGKTPASNAAKAPTSKKG